MDDIFLETGELSDLYGTIGLAEKTSQQIWRIFVFSVDFGWGAVWGEILGTKGGFRSMDDIFL